MLQTLFGLAPINLDPALDRLTDTPLVLDQRQKYSLVAAVGAAERLL